MIAATLKAFKHAWLLVKAYRSAEAKGVAKFDGKLTKAEAIAVITELVEPELNAIAGLVGEAVGDEAEGVLGEVREKLGKLKGLLG